MDGRAWGPIVHGVEKSQTLLSTHTYALAGMLVPIHQWLSGKESTALQETQETRVWSLGWEDLLEEMATHSSTLAWRIPWTEEPGGLQSMGSLRVRHDWTTSLSLFTFMHWRRKWQPTPVFLPGESQGWGSLVGFHLRGHTESDTTEAI